MAGEDSLSTSGAAPMDDGDNDNFSITPHDTFTADGPDTGVDTGSGAPGSNVSLSTTGSPVNGV